MDRATLVNRCGGEQPERRALLVAYGDTRQDAFEAMWALPAIRCPRPDCAGGGCAETCVKVAFPFDAFSRAEPWFDAQAEGWRWRCSYIGPMDCLCSCPG